ncbi:hypothetical protein SAMN02745130_00123 [Thiothrix eikelboomii]|uniref:DUF4878 domain-containing protein n=1 Tax=Thiothrix eikelboomii TaxID=92487 RepID=A0A1T4VS69_9GAMM|nr:hypothetical protein [Thiothrix eikelboomii]SKA67787.1 hypothetical protein SAMN02745130_00123 [Thiothrix eikelboomii]
MQARHYPLQFLFVLVCLLGLLSLTACSQSTEQNARQVANEFWEAILQEDMEKAKALTTWDSTQYLSLLQNKKMSARRFETGELKIENGLAEVATVLYGGDKGELQIPLRTVLSLHDNRWLVDVQKTLGSMVSGAMGAVVDQLNSFMQESLKGLDSSLSENIDKLGKSLEESMNQLQKDLAKPPVNPTPAPPPDSSAQPI